MSKKTIIEAVTDAIVRAQAQRAYGLYDYSKYPGDDPAHVVRYELAKLGESDEVARFHDRETARQLCEKMAHEHVAKAAIQAMTDWLQADLISRREASDGR